MVNLSTVQIICIWVLPVLFAITFHEAGHALVAYRCGDDTAKRQGRLSINPFVHIDLLGTIIVPIVVAYLSHFQFIFGWAKPVPINWGRLKHPKRDAALVALAGPLMNFLMAMVFYFFYWVLSTQAMTSNLSQLFFIETARAGILVNLVLGWFNLLPIPPLDGSRLLSAWLPYRLNQRFLQLEPYGFLIILILIYVGLIQAWLQQILKFMHFIMNIF